MSLDPSLRCGVFRRSDVDPKIRTRWFFTYAA